jgi:hypothetical protein
MIHLLNVKNVTAIVPGAIATNATATGNVIDTKGFKYALITLHQNAASATNSSATLKSITLSESDSTSSFSAISGGGGLTAASGTSWAIPVSNDTNGSSVVVRIGVDLRQNRKRYLQLACTNLASASGVTAIGADCKLGLAEQVPSSDSEAGAGDSILI